MTTASPGRVSSAQQFHHADSDVGDRRDRRRVDVPAPPPGREGGHRLAEAGHGQGVTRVRPLNRVAERRGRRRGQGEVHLRDRKRQDVAGIGLPLGAAPPEQTFQRVHRELLWA